MLFQAFSDQNLVYNANGPLKNEELLFFSNVGVCFSRLLDEYLVLFRKEIEDRKTWIAVSENRMSSSYSEIEDLPGFQKELNEHKVM